MPKFKILYKQKTISYEIEGGGLPVVVWLHGFMENKTIWKHQKSIFKSQFTNVYIDLLGHGETENLAAVHTMEAQAEMVKHILEEHNIQKCTFIGHSMGGYVALAFSENYPKYVSKLVLLNSTSRSDSLEKKQHRDRAIKIVTQQKHNFLRMGIINLFAVDHRENLKLQIEELITNLAQISSEGIVAALEGMKIRPDRSLVLKAFTGKKLIVIGENDPVLPLKLVEEEAQQTNTDLVVLNGGHMSYIEAPLKLNTKLLAFLKEDEI